MFMAYFFLALIIAFFVLLAEVVIGRKTAIGVFLFFAYHVIHYNFFKGEPGILDLYEHTFNLPWITLAPFIFLAGIVSLTKWLIGNKSAFVVFVIVGYGVVMSIINNMHQFN